MQVAFAPNPLDLLLKPINEYSKLYPDAYFDFVNIKTYSPNTRFTGDKNQGNRLLHLTVWKSRHQYSTPCFSFQTPE